MHMMKACGLWYAAAIGLAGGILALGPAQADICSQPAKSLSRAQLQSILAGGCPLPPKTDRAGAPTSVSSMPGLPGSLVPSTDDTSVSRGTGIGLDGGAQDNTGGINAGVGTNAAFGNAAGINAGVGTDAASGNSGVLNAGVGEGAASGNSGGISIGVGENTATNNTGGVSIDVGGEGTGAGSNNTQGIGVGVGGADGLGVSVGSGGLGASFGGSE